MARHPIWSACSSSWAGARDTGAAGATGATATSRTAATSDERERDGEEPARRGGVRAGGGRRARAPGRAREAPRQGAGAGQDARPRARLRAARPGFVLRGGAARELAGG